MSDSSTGTASILVGLLATGSGVPGCGNHEVLERETTAERVELSINVAFSRGFAPAMPLSR